jgi:hypothetical protein
VVVVVVWVPADEVVVAGVVLVGVVVVVVVGVVVPAGVVLVGVVPVPADASSLMTGSFPDSNCQ